MDLDGSNNSTVNTGTPQRITANPSIISSNLWGDEPTGKHMAHMLLFSFSSKTLKKYLPTLGKLHRNLPVSNSSEKKRKAHLWL